MPYNADGTFSADSGVVSAPPEVPITTGRRNSLMNIPKLPAAPKKGFAGMESPGFQEYLEQEATINKVPSIAKMPDSDILQASEDYADKILPVVLKGQGYKYDKADADSIRAHYRHMTAKKLPDIRAYYEAKEKKNPVPEGSNLDYYVKDPLKSISGNVLSGLGEASASVARNASLSNIIALSPFGGGGLVNKLLNNATAPVDNALSKNVLNPTADFINKYVTNSGNRLTNSTSPAYQQAAAEPLANEQGINPKSFNLAKGVEKILAPIAHMTGPVVATALTKNPAFLVGGGTAIGAESSRQQELDRIMGLKPEELANVPAFHALVQGGMDPTTAQRQVAEQAAAAAQKVGAIGGGLTGLAANIPFFKPVAGGLLKRFAGNYLKQAPAFAALAAGQQAATTAATNTATGETRDPSQGVGETAGAAAVGALPFAFAGGRSAAHEGPVAVPPASGEPVVAPTSRSMGPEALMSAAKDAFDAHPLPTGAKAEDPTQLSIQYQKALDVFKGNLRGEDFSSKQIEEAIPQFKIQWNAASGKDIDNLVSPEAEKETNVEPLSAAQIKEALAAEHVPEKLQNKIQEDLTDKLGREASPSEIAQESEKFLSTALSQENIDPLLPKSVLERAVSNLVVRSKELPTAEEINGEARKITKRTNEEKIFQNRKQEIEEQENRLRSKAFDQAKKDEIAAKIRKQDLLNKYVEESKNKKSLNDIDEPINKYEELAADLEKDIVRRRGNVLKKDLARKQGRDLAFSRDYETDRPTGRSVEDARAELVDQLGEEGVSALEKSGILNLVDHQSKLPMEANVPGSAVSGYYDGNKVYLNSQYIPRGQVFPKALHEIGVHYGMPRMLGDELFNKVKNYVEQNKEQPDIRDYYKSANELATNFTGASEETIARIIEANAGKNIGIWKRVTAALRSFLYKTLGQHLPESLANKLLNIDVLSHLAKGALDKAVELSGRDATNGPAFSREEENTWEKIHSRGIPQTKEQLKQQRINDNQPTKAQWISRQVFDNLKPFTHALEKLTSMGVKVKPAENIEVGGRVYQNKASRNVELAHSRVVAPFMTKLVSIASKIGKTPEETWLWLRDYYEGQRYLEVNRLGELRRAHLTDEATEKRRTINQQWAKGEFGEKGEYIDKLQELIDTPGNLKSAVQSGSMSGVSNEVAYTLIKKAQKQGISKGVINEINPLIQNMRDEINNNYKKSNRFSEFDEARRKGLNSKWWLPLKGFMNSKDAPQFDGVAPGAFTKEYTAAKGRKTVAADGLMNLVKEVYNSARDVAENNDFTKSLYKFTKTHGKEFGATVTTRPIEEDIRAAFTHGKGLDDLARTTKSPNIVIHNGGEYRYIIEYPRDSPIMEAAKKINDIPELNWFQKGSGTVTNLISRGATVFNPKFLLWNAIWRDMGYVGSVIGSDLGPAATAKYMIKYWMQGGPLRLLPTYFSGLKPRNSLERLNYAKQSNSKAAKLLKEMSENGADLSFEHGLNYLRNIEDVHRTLKEISRSNIDPRRLIQGGIHILDQLGTSLSIMPARVAAYETYIDTAVSKLKRKPTEEELGQIKKDAGMFARRVLDYQQRGNVAGHLNTVYPFARVALTQVDRMAQSFKNADGSFNKPKAAIMTAFGMAMGAIYYSMLRQTDPNIKKQENSTLAQSFIIPNGTDNPIKIPMAYGLTRLMLVPGMMAARLAYGDSNGVEAGNTLRNTLAESFAGLKLPEGGNDASFHNEFMDFLEGLTPGAGRPILDIERNKNNFGSPIAPDDQITAAAHKLHSEAGFRSTPEAWKWLAEELHEITGGAIDVYPESLEYLTSAYGTGPASGLLRAAAMSDPGHRDMGGLPYLPNLTSRDADFYEVRKLREIEQELSSKIANKTASPREIEDHKHLVSVRKTMAKERNVIIDNKLMSQEVKNTHLESIQQRQKQEQVNLLRKYEQ